MATNKKRAKLRKLYTDYLSDYGQKLSYQQFKKEMGDLEGPKIPTMYSEKLLLKGKPRTYAAYQKQVSQLARQGYMGLSAVSPKEFAIKSKRSAGFGAVDQLGNQSQIAFIEKIFEDKTLLETFSASSNIPNNREEFNTLLRYMRKRDYSKLTQNEVDEILRLLVLFGLAQSDLNAYSEKL